MRVWHIKSVDGEKKVSLILLLFLSINDWFLLYCPEFRRLEYKIFKVSSFGACADWEPGESKFNQLYESGRGDGSNAIEGEMSESRPIFTLLLLSDFISRIHCIGGCDWAHGLHANGNSVSGRSHIVQSIKFTLLLSVRLMMNSGQEGDRESWESQRIWYSTRHTNRSIRTAQHAPPTMSHAHLWLNDYG